MKSLKTVNNPVLCTFLYLYTVFYDFLVGLLILDLENKQFNWDHTQRGYSTPVKLLHPVLKLDLGSLSCL